MHLRILACLVVVTLAGCADDSAPEQPDEQLEVDEDLEATSSTGVIRGVVVSPSIIPIEGVTVTVRSTGAEAVTNANGEFGFSGLEPGTYFLRAEKIGYNASDSSVTVEAGIDRPPIVRMLIEPNAAAAPYMQVLEFEGFLQCSVTAGIGGNLCGLVEIVTGEPIDTPLISYQLDGQPMWIQSEMLWDSTQPLGDELQLMYSWPGPECDPFLCDHDTAGTSPVILSLDAAQIEEIGFGTDYELMIRVFNEGLSETDGLVGFTFEQRFTVFTTVFYGFAPPDGYLYTEDGEISP